MKYSLCIATIICLLIGFSSSIQTSGKGAPQFPNVGKIADEYLIQNTVNFAKKNAIFQTDIDKKYTILNGLSAAEDNSNTPSTLYTKDSAPYYDPTKPQARPIKNIPYQGTALNRYTTQLYPLDRNAYYGPSQPFRPIVNGAGDHFAVPSTMGNLEQREATQKNIDELKKQLDKINNWIEGPKYMTQDDKGREVYFKDAKAYYDPTLLDKQAQKASLQAQIRDLTNEMNQEKPNLIIGTVKSSVSIQNRINTNREETNEFIANSYYYPVDRSTLANRSNKMVMGNTPSNLKKEEPNKHQAFDIYTKKPVNAIIGSTNKYYDDNKKNSMVEAESSGYKIDKRFYYEEKKASVPEAQAAVKSPNTQGLKTAGFRILRKN